MPLYEYQCDSCAHRFERIQKFTDPAPDACPSCGGTVKKLLSSPAIQFKGTGWYITDYARKSPTNDSKSGTDSKDGASSSSSSSDGSSASAASSRDSQGSKGSQESKSAQDSKVSTNTSAKKD